MSLKQAKKFLGVLGKSSKDTEDISVSHCEVTIINIVYQKCACVTV